jgi:hypothetical protein
MHRLLPFGSALSRRSRRHLRQSPTVTERGSTHLDTAFTGLTSSRSVTNSHTLRPNGIPPTPFPADQTWRTANVNHPGFDAHHPG